MRPTVRAAAALLALASLVLAGAGPAVAADPSTAPSVGGALSVNPTEVRVLSNGSVPAHVVLSTDGTAVLTPSSFDLQPGEVGRAAVSGEPHGTVSAAFSVSLPGAGERSGVVLEAAFDKTPAPTDWLAIGLRGLAGLAGLVALAYLLRRTKPWRYRLTRAGAA